MSEKIKFKTAAEKIEVNLAEPKTAEQWCKLYYELSGKDIYRYMNWGDETESSRLLTHDDFQKKAKACRIDLGDSGLIADVNKIILG